jgi:cation diffusion facilitator family transporter
MLPEERGVIGQKAAMVGVIGNLFLSILKFTVGVTSGSMAVIADALHSFSDILVSAGTWLAIKISSKPNDESHPYGHGDVEPLVGLFISIILAIMGFEFAKHSYNLLTSPMSIPQYSAVYVTIFAIVFKEAMSRYTFKIADKINSPTLKADAYHHRGDVYTSIAVVIGVMGSILGYPLLDPLVGIVVSLIIIKIGYDIGKQNIFQLLGTVPSPELKERIIDFISSYSDVKLIHRIRIHGIGAYYAVDLHVCVDENLPLKDAHRISHKVEKIILDEFSDISTVLVHIEPYDIHHQQQHSNAKQRLRAYLSLFRE